MSPLWSITRETCSCSIDPFVSASSRSMSWRNAQSDSLARFGSRPSEITLAAVRHQPQVRERVLDLLTLEEPHAAVDSIRDPGREQPFLEHARLRVRAV